MRWRSLRGVVAVAVLVVMTAAVPVLIAGTSSRDRNLDPADTSLAGSRALAELLRRHGVTVHRVDDPRAVAEAARIEPSSPRDTLLLVSAPGALPPQAARRLAALRLDRLVIGIDPAGHLTRRARPAAPVRATSRAPECDLPAARRAGSAHTGGLAFGPVGEAVGEAAGCYPVERQPTLLRYAAGGRTVTVVGSGAFMTNQRLDEDGNAALAMNLAGSHQRLVWLVRPDEPQVAGPGGDSLAALVPERVWWFGLQVAIAVGLIAMWRGRRLGPVVTETLPVAVRAAETVEGRGQLYRSRRARDRAAIALRSAALHRLAPALRLPGTAPPPEVVRAVVARVGHDADHVRETLYGTPPVDDAALVALADSLDALEREVHDS